MPEPLPEPVPVFAHRVGPIRARAGLCALVPATLTALALTLAGCPAQGIPSYDPCVAGQRCLSPTDTCVEIVFPGPTGEGVASMCTLQRCVVDPDCPADARGAAGACLAFDAAQSTCFERCERLADCATGWSCQALAPVGRDEVRVCVPAAP